MGKDEGGGSGGDRGRLGGGGPEDEKVPWAEAVAGQRSGTTAAPLVGAGIETGVQQAPPTERLKRLIINGAFPQNKFGLN